MILPKIGLLTVGGSPAVATRGVSAREYWGEDVRDKAISRLERLGIEVIRVPDVVFSIIEMAEVAHLFRSADVDLVVIYFTSIGEEALALI